MTLIDHYLDKYNLELTEDSGREVARVKDLFYTHTGVIMGRNKYSKEKMIFHNHPTSGPALDTMKNYEKGRRCTYTAGPSDSWDQVLLRSFNQLESGAEYKLMSYNCQDATSISRTGSTGSYGRTNTFGALALLAIFAMIAK